MIMHRMSGHTNSVAVCECGFRVRGASEMDAVAKVREHMHHSVVYRKRFTDSELAAEYWKTWNHRDPIFSYDYKSMEREMLRIETLLRFAQTASYDEEECHGEA